MSDVESDYTRETSHEQMESLASENRNTPTICHIG